MNHFQTDLLRDFLNGFVYEGIAPKLSWCVSPKIEKVPTNSAHLLLKGLRRDHS